MSDLFFNKIAAAALATVLGMIGINRLAANLIEADVPDVREFAYLPEMDLKITSERPVEVPFPSIDWINGRNAVKGAKLFKRCTSCHNVANGGKHGTGPNLWNVVGRTAGTKDGFSYSGVMSASGITWGYEELNGYLANPKAYLPKNNMAFIGFRKEADRAAVIEHLRLAADVPVVPLTEAAPIPSVEPAQVIIE